MLSFIGEEIMYYDINKTLSKQRLFNFVIGARGVGKTYGSKKRCTENFLKAKKQFVYLRRYETEMPAAEMRNFFDDIAEEFPGHEFSAHNGLFRIDGEIAGWYFPLSKAVMLKSIPFPNVSLIIFDEFIIETGIYQYLPNEVRTFLECYSTISRDRDVTAIFLSNAITMTNPYFIYFNIALEPGQTVKLLKHISVEVITNQDFIEHMSNTRFGELVAGTEYGEYNIKNKFILDTDSFLENLPGGCIYMSTLIIGQRKIGSYIGIDPAKMYLSPKTDPSCKRIFALTQDTHDTNTILAQRQNPYIKQIVLTYCNGNLRFTTQEVKNLMTPILRRML